MLPVIGAVVGGLGGASGIGGIVGGVIGGIGKDIAKDIGKNIVGQLFNRILEKAGLPPIVKDALQMAVAGAMGDSKEIRKNLDDLVKDCTKNMHPFDAIKLEQAAQHCGYQLEKCFHMAQAHDEKHGCMPGNSKKGGVEEGGSWLMQLAAVLGEIMNKKADKLKEMGDKLDGAGEGGTTGANKGTTSGTTTEGTAQGSTETADGTNKAHVEFEAKSKEFALMFEAVNNVMKTIGDALNSAARK